MERHIIIEAVTPVVDCGRYPAKRIAGQPCIVEADIFRDGHDIIRAVVKWRRAGDDRFRETPMKYVDNDRWRGQFPLDEAGRYVFTIEAWTDLFRSWRAEFTKRVEAKQPEAASEMATGLLLLEKTRRRATGGDMQLLGEVLDKLRSVSSDLWEVVHILLEARLLDVVERLAEREDAVTYAPELEIVADRPIAGFGAWYEMFVRSSGTFRSAEKRLHEIRDMGFNVVYLAPIHPIGRTNRKGRNNSLKAGREDPGSPWAIGSEAGGHTAVEPSLARSRTSIAL